MAPAAADTICQNLMDFNRQPQDYDRIITGDLGYVGQTILLELLKEKGFDIKSSIWTAESKFMTVSYRIHILAEAAVDVPQ